MEQKKDFCSFFVVNFKDSNYKDLAIELAKEERWEIEKDNLNWQKVFKIEKPEKQRISVFSSQYGVFRDKVKIVLVNKEEREILEKEIWKKINQPETELCYIFEKENGDFYAP